MARADLAVIGGTGVYRADMLEKTMEIEVETSYGRVNLLKGSLKGREIAFLARHGKGHTVPPHLIDYRANICALKNLGVKRIIATAAVGSLNENMKPLDFVIVDQFLDFTKGRKFTFYEGGEKGVLHVDMTEPYCREAGSFIYDQAKALDLPVHLGGCYVATEGPRFETPAEIRMFKLLGGDVVGMTGVPEVVLAREAGMCYAAIAMVTNFAAGISPAALSHGEVVEAVKKINSNISRLIMSVLESIPLDTGCRCKLGPEEAGKL
ncbi:MAG: S-methyl-5'-thioadenosine phosphorylase [Peptococcaceae bacterium]|jgi:5'-methylthioadenosine phosphorylase|nr:S-methyl-5'-thioadenosine phosphorylase [Peptococcaceae bacterium]MDH7525458.1 S-methyl-5'-thioadenosine phosphorylase [Peptococcaceae bacterium]